MRLTNRWNRLVYRLWAPLYDGVFDRVFAASGRRQAIATLNAQRGEWILFVGIGTGADLPLLPAGVFAVGVDFSPEMLSRARARARQLQEQKVILAQGDAQMLPLPGGAFDAAVLNLVLSVVPDGAACLRETVRVLKPGGRIVVFDKFLPNGKSVGIGRGFLNLITTALGTDITRHLSDILAGNQCLVVSNEPSLLRGKYRVIVLQTAKSPSPV